MSDELNLVNPTTPIERRERLVRDLYTAAGSKKPDDAHTAIRELLSDQIWEATFDVVADRERTWRRIVAHDLCKALGISEDPYTGFTDLVSAVHAAVAERNRLAALVETYEIVGGPRDEEQRNYGADQTAKALLKVLRHEGKYPGVFGGASVRECAEEIERMKLDPIDQGPLRVLRDVLKAVPETEIFDPGAVRAVSAALTWALEASSAATRASDGQDAEPAPSSPVPEATVKGEDLAPLAFVVGSSQYVGMFAHTQAVAAAREAGRRERDTEVAELRAIVGAIEGHLGLMSGEDVVACVKDCLAQQRERIDAELYVQERDALQVDLARVTTERDAFRDDAKAAAFSLAEEMALADVQAARSALAKAQEELREVNAEWESAIERAKSAEDLFREAQAAQRLTAEVRRWNCGHYGAATDPDCLVCEERGAVEMERIQVLKTARTARAAGRREGIEAAAKRLESMRGTVGSANAAQEVRSLLSEPPEICPSCGLPPTQNRCTIDGPGFGLCRTKGKRYLPDEPAPEASPVGEGRDDGYWLCPCGFKNYPPARCGACADPRAVPETPPQAGWVKQAQDDAAEVATWPKYRQGRYAKVAQDAARPEASSLTPEEVAAWVASPEGQAALVDARDKAAEIIRGLNEARRVKDRDVKLAAEAGVDSLVARLRAWLRLIDARSDRPNGDDARLHALLTEAAAALEGAKEREQHIANAAYTLAAKLLDDMSRDCGARVRPIVLNCADWVRGLVGTRPPAGTEEDGKSSAQKPSEALAEEAPDPLAPLNAPLATPPTRVLGWMITETEVTRRIAQAVAEEREACAKIADRHKRHWEPRPNMPYNLHWEARSNEARTIAVDIRARAKKGE